MLTTLKRLRTCRPALNTGFFPLNKRVSPLVSYPKKPFITLDQQEQSTMEPLALKHAQQDLEADIERLTAQRIVEAIDQEGMMKSIESVLLEYNKSPEEYRQIQMKKMQ